MASYDSYVDTSWVSHSSDSNDDIGWSSLSSFPPKVCMSYSMLEYHLIDKKCHNLIPQHGCKIVNASIN